MSGRRNTEVKLVARSADYSFVCVDIQDELEGLGALLGDGSEQTRGEQRSHVVGTAPGHRATRIMNGLEVEPVGDSGLEVDHHVLGHGVAVGESSAWNSARATTASSMALFRTDSSSSGSSSNVASVSPAQARQDERPVGIDPNRSAVEAPVDLALPLLPIPLREDPHAGIQDPDQRTAQPDQERRVEQAVLSHLKLAVLRRRSEPSSTCADRSSRPRARHRRK